MIKKYYEHRSNGVVNNVNDILLEVIDDGFLVEVSNSVENYEGIECITINLGKFEKTNQIPGDYISEYIIRINDYLLSTGYRLFPYYFTPSKENRKIKTFGEVSFSLSGSKKILSYGFDRFIYSLNYNYHYSFINMKYIKELA